MCVCVRVRVCMHEFVCTHVCVVEMARWLVLIFSSTDIQICGVLDPFNA